MPFASHLFPGGSTEPARDWARAQLHTWDWTDAAPIVDALIATVHTRRPWWLHLRNHRDALHAQIYRARTTHTPHLPTEIPGTEHLTWTYYTAPTPDGQCIWTTITPAEPNPARLSAGCGTVPTTTEPPGDAERRPQRQTGPTAG